MSKLFEQAAAKRMSERELQKAVILLARTLGFRVAHFPTVQTSTGWRTAVQGDAGGFPDLILAGHGKVAAVELKADRGAFGPGQRRWLDELGAAGVNTYVWRPKDWSAGLVEAELQRLAGRPSRGAAERTKGAGSSDGKTDSPVEGISS